MDQDSALIPLLQQHRPLLQAYILAHTRDHDHAADIYQEVCLTIFEKFAQFETGTNFKAWAMQIARFKLLSHYRNQTDHQRLLHLSPELAETLVEPVLTDDGELNHDRQALRICLGKITGRNRTLVLKRYGEGLSCQEVAQAINWTVNAVYVALSRIRSALERCIIAERQRLDKAHD